MQDQARTRNSLRLLEEFGLDLGMPHSRHIRGKLWELRLADIRLFYFAYGSNQFVILHAYRKASTRAPAREIEIALKRMEELLNEG